MLPQIYLSFVSLSELWHVVYFEKVFVRVTFDKVKTNVFFNICVQILIYYFGRVFTIETSVTELLILSDLIVYIH